MNKNCPNKNCIGGVITFNGATGRDCKKCNPSPSKKNDTLRSKLNAGERKIYDAILSAFPATSKESAYDYAIQGGVKFQYID
jgi:hypothetical protein